MNMLNTLFVPSGIIRGRPYWLACAILILAELLIMLAGYMFIINSQGLQGMMIGSAAGMLLWLLIYPYFCVYGKRLHDMGASAWFFLLILAVYAVLTWIVQMAIMMPAMLGEDGIMQQQMQAIDEMAQAQDSDTPPDFSALMESQMQAQKALMQKVFLPNMIGGLCVSALISGILGVIKPKLENNPYRDFDAGTFN